MVVGSGGGSPEVRAFRCNFHECIFLINLRDLSHKPVAIFCFPSPLNASDRLRFCHAKPSQFRPSMNSTRSCFLSFSVLATPCQIETSKERSKHMMTTLNAQCSINHMSHNGETLRIALTIRWSSWSLLGPRICWASTSRCFSYGRIDVESCCWSLSYRVSNGCASDLTHGHGYSDSASRKATFYAFAPELACPPLIPCATSLKPGGTCHP